MQERLGLDVIRCVGYGHVGDGNMHLNITTKDYDKNVLDKIEPFLYEYTSKVHGSISAEHGKLHHNVRKFCCPCLTNSKSYNWKEYNFLMNELILKLQLLNN